MNGPHDCGPRAVAACRPDIPHQKIMESFKKVCKRGWPSGGVYSPEFEEVLTDLKIKFKRVYNYENGTKKMSSIINENFGNKYLAQMPSYFFKLHP